MDGSTLIIFYLSVHTFKHSSLGAWYCVRSVSNIAFVGWPSQMHPGASVVWLQCGCQYCVLGPDKMAKVMNGYEYRHQPWNWYPVTP